MSLQLSAFFCPGGEAERGGTEGWAPLPPPRPGPQGCLRQLPALSAPQPDGMGQPQAWGQPRAHGQPGTCSHLGCTGGAKTQPDLKCRAELLCRASLHSCLWWRAELLKLQAHFSAAVGVSGEKGCVCFQILLSIPTRISKAVFESRRATAAPSSGSRAAAAGPQQCPRAELWAQGLSTS